MNPLLKLAIKAARSAGKIILRHSERIDRVAVQEKGRNDFVSAVDRMAEDEIVDCIRRLYPAHKIIAEERAFDASGKNTDAGENVSAAATPKPPPKKSDSGGGDKKDAREVEWIIDPLDGTANFLHGHPHYAISIAAREQGRLQYAVIFDPLRDELFTASRGGGAQLNDRRLRVTGQLDLSRALLATGFPFRAQHNFDEWQARFCRLLPRVSDMRRGGSAALDLAYVAAGRLDGFWESGLSEWDIAAGVLLVREAGGLVADFQGEQNFLENGDILAANRHLFNQLLHCIAPPKG